MIPLWELPNVEKSIFWGYNGSGTLGAGGAKPQELPSPEDDLITQVACGWGHNLAITKNGYIYSWGYNGQGQTGLGLGAGNTNQPGLIQFGSEEQEPHSIYNVGCGYNHSYAISKYGKVYGWGQNMYGEIGFLSESQNVDKPTEIPDVKCLVLLTTLMELFPAYLILWPCLHRSVD